MSDMRSLPTPTQAPVPTPVARPGAGARLYTWLRTTEGLAFLAIFLPMVAIRVTYAVTVSDFGADGGYYTDVARHVRDGDGLLTDISVFHQGFPELPHPTSVYPAWPMMLGLISRFVPLSLAATWVPTLLATIAVVFAFLVGRRFAPAPLWAGDSPSPRVPLHGGHLLLSMFALSPSFLTATARPYTEALAFLTLFAFLWRAPSLLARPGLRTGVECGLWLALLLYERSQHVVVIFAVLAVVGLGALVDRGRLAWVGFGGVALATLVAAFLPFQRSIDAWLEEPGFGRYLRFDAARVPSGLSEVPIMFQTEGAIDWLIDRLSGVYVAYTWGGRLSYYDGLGALTFAMPVAVCAGAWVLWRARSDGSLGEWLREALSPERRWHLLFVIVSFAAVSSLHTVHKVYGDPWAFGQRHSLIAALGFFVAVVGLARLRGTWALIAFVLTVAATERNSRDAVHVLSRQTRDWLEGDRLDNDLVEVRTHLENARVEAGGTVTVAVNRPWPQRLAWRTPGVGYHWLTQSTNFDDLRLMVDELGVTEVLIFPGVDPAFLNDPRFPQAFAGTELIAYRPARTKDPEEPPDAPEPPPNPDRMVKVYRVREAGAPSPEKARTTTLEKGTAEDPAVAMEPVHKAP